MAGPLKQVLFDVEDELARTSANLHWSARESRLCHGLSEAAKNLYMTLVLTARFNKYVADEWAAKVDYDRLQRLTGLSLTHCKRMVKLLEKTDTEQGSGRKILLVERGTGPDGSEVNTYILPAREMWRIGRINYAAELQLIQAANKAKLERRAAYRGITVAELAARPGKRNPASTVTVTEEDQAVLDDLGPQEEEKTTTTPDVDITIDVATADFRGYEEPRSYYLALEVYRAAGRTTVSSSTLRAAAELMTKRITLDGGEPLTDIEYNDFAERIVWLCSVKCRDWFRSKYKTGCPCLYVLDKWGNGQDDNRLGHQARDGRLKADEAHKPMVPAWVDPTVAYPELSCNFSPTTTAPAAPSPSPVAMRRVPPDHADFDADDVTPVMSKNPIATAPASPEPAPQENLDPEIIFDIEDHMPKIARSDAAIRLAHRMYELLDSGPQDIATEDASALYLFTLLDKPNSYREVLDAMEWALTETTFWPGKITAGPNPGKWFVKHYATIRTQYSGWLVAQRNAEAKNKPRQVDVNARGGRTLAFLMGQGHLVKD